MIYLHSNSRKDCANGGSGRQRSKRLVAYVQDETGLLELVWFKGIKWVKTVLNLIRNM